MTINIADNSPRISYLVAEGVLQNSFAIPFEFFDEADINVYVNGVLKTLTTDYTLTGGDGSTGTANISVVGVAGGTTVVITRDIVLERTTDFPVSGAFNIVALNTELDRLVAVAADLDDRASRSIQATDFDAAADFTLPLLDDRKGKILAFNDTTGSIEAGPSITDAESVALVSADIALLADIQDGTVDTDVLTNLNSIRTNITTTADSITSVNTVASSVTNINNVASAIGNINIVGGNITNVNTVAGISTAVSTVAANNAKVNTLFTNIGDIQTLANIEDGTVATTALSDLAAIDSQITDIHPYRFSIGTVAANTANISTVATNIANVGVVAGQTTNLQNVTDNLTAIQNAATNATAAENAKTAAEAAQAAAELAADNFDDTYLGSKSSDPTVDNDGGALNAGDLYFNTTSNTLRVYSGSAWQDAAIDSSGFVQTTGDTLTGNLSFGDNDKAIFGAGSDLQIYHSGTSSDIDEVGTGNLRIGAENFVVQNADHTENMISAAPNGQVVLYHDNSIKFNTSSTGIDVTGTVTADGLTVDGVAEISAANTRLNLYETDTTDKNTQFQSSNSRLMIKTLSDDGATTTERLRVDHSTGNISFYEDTGTTAKFFWDASAESLGIGTTSPIALLNLSESVSTAYDSTGISSATYQQHIVNTNTGANTGAFLALSSNDNGTGTAVIGSIGGSTLKDSQLVFLTRDGSASGDPIAERMRIDSSGNVGIGTSSPSGKLEVAGTVKAYGNGAASLNWGDTTTLGTLSFDGSANPVIRSGSLKPLVFQTNGANERMRINSSGNVGIGTSSPSAPLHVNGGSSGGFATVKHLELGYTASRGLTISTSQVVAVDDLVTFDAPTATYGQMAFKTAGSERMRIDSSGNLLVGTTSTTVANETGTSQGVRIAGAQNIQVASTGISAYFNKLDTDGDIVEFRKSATPVGSIGVDDNASDTNKTIYICSQNSVSSLDVGFKFDWNTNQITPCQSGGANRDNAVDLGSSSVRFDDIYATNGTIQTSDQNEKQDIAELSEAEQRVAVAAKGLLRKFRWKDAVAEKGDEARTHFGIIAQDLQAAFAAEGLDAGDYAMFIHTTWTDEETGEERSRMGVRYSELLAFIIAAI